MNLDKELNELYEKWLLAEYSDEIHNKDDHITAYENKLHWDDFVSRISKVLEIEVCSDCEGDWFN